jgi:DNA-binding winged helix-turn-helix (wHTH) protein
MIRIAEVEVRPPERLIAGPSNTLALEPLVMALLVELAQHAGRLVSRKQLFQKLWGGAPVGDDSLNRIVRLLRRSLVEAGATSLTIETVPAAGYVLRLRRPHDCDNGHKQIDEAIAEAVDSWRLGLPSPDHLRIALLTRASELAPANARVHGLLALQQRHATEYGDSADSPFHLQQCERHGRLALSMDPQQPEALTALVSVAPLYGAWHDSFTRLTDICSTSVDHPVPNHDLAVLEMATGQVAAATERRERLSAADPFAAVFAYKAVYQYWSLGRRTAMDHAADRAVQMWPHHPAVWAARFWTFLYSDRAAAAEAMTRQPPIGLPAAMVEFLRDVALDFASGRREALAIRAKQVAGLGPSQAITALFILGASGSVDDSFEVAARYYLQADAQPVPMLPKAGHPRLNEQNRRLTQVLFTPAAARMRKDNRFAELTRQIGLEDFWSRSEIAPDYRCLR